MTCGGVSHESHVRCAHCGYDRFGTEVAAACPECGRRRVTKHFAALRRLRLWAALLLAVGGLQLALGLGFWLCLKLQGVRVNDVALIGTENWTERPEALRAAPFMDVTIATTNLLCSGSLALLLLTVVSVVIALSYREVRAALRLLVALAFLGGALAIGLAQSAALDLAP